MNFAKQVVIYGLGSAISRLAVIFLVPLYTRAFTMKEYGQLEVLLGLYTLVTLLGGLQSESALARDYFDAKATGSTRRLTWGAASISICGAFLTLLAIFLIQWTPFVPFEIDRYLPLLAIMAFFSQILGVQLVVLRFSGSPVIFALLSLLDLSLTAIFSIFLVVHLDWGISGALAAILAAKMVCVVIISPRTLPKPGRLPSRRLIARMLSYGVPAMPAVILNWFQTNGNRIILALFLTLADVAVAAVAIKVAALYMVIVFSFRMAWEPYSFSKISEHKSNPEFFNAAFQWYVLIMLAIACVTVSVSPIIVYILAPREYSGAISLVAFFVMSQFWAGAGSILSIGIHGARVTSRLTHVYLAGALVNVGALALSATDLGTLASGIGALFGALASAWVSYFISERCYGTGFSRRLLLVTSLTTVAFAFACDFAYAYLREPGADLAEDMTLYICMGVAGGALVALVAMMGLEPGRFKGMRLELISMARCRVGEK
ncbi:lipopolysaccharide biosynthesis protein [Allosphingosinicella vermicomposti]|uniref:lipopolysaccharide biosynthesis protein n=1 Tax=Allosphingosinicella vermicomposti TaxID=614671 RepID=UPI000D0F9A0A|nr:oligosaccharide flippase family protein [Allosphingosinicella vermicomposti]